MTQTIQEDRDVTLEEFWYNLAEWSNRTFGYEHDRGPVGPLRHLAKEVQETLDQPTELIEYADMLHLIFDACRRAGYSYDDLRHAAAYKLSVNQHRLWPKPTSDEPVEHIRDSAP
jgi:ParB family chromosome partitioning protein